MRPNSPKKSSRVAVSLVYRCDSFLGSVKNLDPSNTGATFESVYCLKNRIKPSRFEHRLLGDGVMTVFRPLVSFLCLVFPSVFRGELENLTSLGKVRNRRDFVSEMRVITDFNDYQLPLWRSMLGLRISTRRLSKLRELLPKSKLRADGRPRSKQDASGASLNE